MSRQEQKTGPLYAEVARSLEDRIATMHPHAALPTERALMTEFGVSRVTVRNALARLIGRGLVYNVQGSGTFVAPREVVSKTLRLTSFSEDMVQRGYEPSSRVLACVRGPLSGEAVEQLGAPPGSTGLVIDRLRLADGSPMAIEHVELLVDESHELDPDASLYAALTSVGLHVARAAQTIRAANLTADQARHLDQAVGAAALAVSRITYTDRGEAIEAAETIYRADRYSFQVVVERNR